LAVLQESKAILARALPVERCEAYWQAYETRLQEKRKRPRIQSFPIRFRPLWSYGLIALAMLLLSVSVATGSVSPSKLEITSDVPGATVYLDGAVAGITPLLTKIKAGDHTVSLHKEGYQTWNYVFSALSSTPVQLEVKLISLATTRQANLEGMQQFTLPSLSPDGQVLTFLGSTHSFTKGSGELWLYQMEKDRMEKTAESLAMVRPTWSPDSRRLAYVQVDGPDDRLMLYERESRRQTLLTSELAISQVAWLAPRQLVFLSGERSQMTLLNLENKEQRTLVTGPVERFAPSPDARWIAYVSAQDGKIYLVSLVTSVNREIKGTSGECLGLAWSPDGKQLAIACRQGLHTIDLSSDQEQLIVDRTAMEVTWLPDRRLLWRQQDDQDSESLWLWSDGNAQKIAENAGPGTSLLPDASTLIFTGNRAGFQTLWRTSLSATTEMQPLFTSRLLLSSEPQAAEIYLGNRYLGRTPTTLTGLEPGLHELTLKKETYQDWHLALSLSSAEAREVKARLLAKGAASPLTTTGGEKTEAVFSPDGSRVAYVEGTGEDAQLTLFEMTRRISIPLGIGWRPAWSADGEALYFVRGATYSDVWVYYLASADSVQLTHSGGARDPKPAPDGGWVAYLQGLDPLQLELWVMNVDGKDARRLAQDEAGHIFAFQWMPDSQKVFYLSHHQGTDAANLVDLEGNVKEFVSAIGFSLPVWSAGGDFLALQAWSESNSEIRIYRQPEGTFYASQEISAEKCTLFWQNTVLFWTAPEAGGFRWWSWQPQNAAAPGIAVADARFLSFSPALNQGVSAASWNGYSQLYLDRITP
jgi:Tol biopolymer transport system component